MRVDRVLIKQTNKELNLTNGDLAKLTYVSKEKFTVEITNSANEKKEISFNPSNYHSFTHGYATTIFKAQGISINEVFVLHDGFSTIRNSYVALSRNIKDLKLYTNSKATKSTEHLIKQLSYDPDTSSSLNYFTKRDLEKAKLNKDFNATKGIFASIIVGAMEYGLKKFTEFTDKNLAKTDYYSFKSAKVTKEKVEEVLDKLYEEVEQERVLHNATHLAKAVGSDLVMSNYSSSLNESTLDLVNKPITTIAKEIKHEVSTNNPNNNSYTNNNNLIQKKSSTNSFNEKNKLDITNILNNTKLSAKERFYKNADYKRKRVDKEVLREAIKDQWGKESNLLRSEVKFKAEQIAKDLLGDPNKKLSNGKTLRYGDTGKLAVRISGEKAGTWYDFSESKGGDIFALIQDKKGFSFKEAADYLRNALGLSQASFNPHLKVAYDHQNRDITENYIKNKEAEERANKAKQEQVTKLYARSKDISETSVAAKYLKIHRAITFNSSLLSKDIRTTGVGVTYEVEREEEIALHKGEAKKKYLPALIAFARDKDCNITGGQQILLNPKTGAKAEMDIPKKSFGKIAGSFVDVGEIRIGGVKVEDIKSYNSDNSLQKIKDNINTTNITIIAEGLETALSVKQALEAHNEQNSKEQNNRIKINTVNVKILCSLGISNISNYKPTKEEKIIIAADNDGTNSITNKTIENAKTNLQNHGAFVEVVRPNREGDFNDILQKEGVKEIQESFKNAINLHSAKTLSEYIKALEAKDGKSSHIDQTFTLTKQDQENLKTIEHYNIDQTKLVNIWRRSFIQGKLELEDMRKERDFTERLLQQNKHLAAIKPQLAELDKLAYKCDKDALVNTIKSMSHEEKQNYINKILANETKRYVEPMIARYVNYRNNSVEHSNIPTFIKAIMYEQDMWVELYDRHKAALYILDKQNGNLKLSVLAKSASDLGKNESREEISKTIDYAIKHNIVSKHSIIESLNKNNGNLDYIYSSIKYKCKTHETKFELIKQQENAKANERDKESNSHEKHISGPKL